MQISRTLLIMGASPLIFLASCKTTEQTSSEVAASSSEVIEMAEKVDLCRYATTLANTPSKEIPKIDEKIQRLLAGSGADALLTDNSPEARFAYIKALILGTHEQINKLMNIRMEQQDQQSNAKSSYDSSYISQPPSPQEVAAAEELTYWLNNSVGVCQGCDKELLSTIKTFLDKKVGELRSCNWPKDAGTDTTAEATVPNEDQSLGLVDTSAQSTVKELIDFIKSEKKAEKLCDVGLYYSFGDNVQCTHKYVKESCNKYLEEGEAPKLDDKGIEKLKDVLESCTTAYGGERAGRAARLAIDKFHNALKDGDSYAHAAAEAACTGGAALVGSKVQSTPQIDFENACRDLSPFGAGFFTKERAASCFNTSASICRVAFNSGSLGLYQTIPGGKSIVHAEARKIIYAAEGALCQGSKTTAVACNTINEAGKQIYQAIKTGNNDWAHCVGTDKLGACIGNLYGSKGWTNNSGVATAQKTDDGTAYRACCWCKRRYYADDHWIKNDTMFRSENWFSVIQQGDVKSGNCGFKDGQVIKNQPIKYKGDDVYYKYEECDKWYVKGEQCAVVDGTTQRVWNGKNKSWFSVHVP